MLLNPNTDNPYSSLNKDSTELEKMDVAFQIIKDATTPILLDHHKLCLDQNEIKIFEAKIKNTNLVEYRLSGYYNSFKLNTEGILALDKFDSYSAYNENLETYLKEKQGAKEKKENLELQKLTSDVMLITKQLADYDKVKDRSIRSEWIAIFAAVVTLIGLVLQLILRKHG